MSGLQRIQGQRVPHPSRSLMDQLWSMGIWVPDQLEVRRKMEAVRLGLHYNTPVWKVNLKWIWLTLRSREMVEWQTFPLSHYFMQPDGYYGAPMPEPISVEVQVVLASISSAQVLVHAIPGDDPWIEYRLSGQSVFTRGWIRWTTGHQIIS